MKIEGHEQAFEELADQRVEEKVLEMQKQWRFLSGNGEFPILRITPNFGTIYPEIMVTLFKKMKWTDAILQ